MGYRSISGPPRLSNELDALLRQVARGDSAAFATVYDLTKARVYGLVTRGVHRRAGHRIAMADRRDPGRAASKLTDAEGPAPSRRNHAFFPRPPRIATSTPN